jgi:hypothetical protein
MNKHLKLACAIGLKPSILYVELLDYAWRLDLQDWFILETEDIKNLVTPYCLQVLSKNKLIQYQVVEGGFRFKLNSDTSVLEKLVNSEV